MTASTDQAGAPSVLHADGTTLTTQRTLGVWQHPGGRRFVQLVVRDERTGQQAVAEISGGPDGWQLRHLYR